MANRLVVALGVALVLVLPLYGQEEKPFFESSEHHHGELTAEVEALDPPDTLAAVGSWATLATLMPINPVHMALMNNGKVLVIAGSGNDPSQTRFMAGVWDPVSLGMTTFNINWDMFCNGMVVLPDGRPFVMGGTIAYDSPGVNFKGEPRTAAFRPVQGNFVDQARMHGGRWYPTGTVLGDGTVMVIAGFNDTDGNMNPFVQIYNAGTNTWRNAGTAFPGVPLYPRQHLLPSGKVFVSGARPQTRLWDPVTFAWTIVDGTVFNATRDYGTSVLLPLTPENGFKPKVLIAGGGPGGGNVTATTETIDLSLAAPKWVAGPNMAAPRIQLNGTLLPSGEVLLSGGSSEDEKASTAVFKAELYSPATNTLRPAATMRFPRLYHSNTLLLPDARVVAMGGNPARRVYEPHIEVYTPPYLLDAGGGLAPRPAVTAAPATLTYGQTFRITTTAALRSVVLIRPGTPTHSFDMDQRMVGLRFTPGSGFVDAVAPANGKLAPPGYYMLFVVNTAGVPSVAKFVLLK